MTTRDLYEDLLAGLQARYEPAEAQSISRMILEDAFEHRLRQEHRELTAEEETLYRHILQRLLRGEPVQYILGEADFFGLKFLVDRRVLIPRQETEELVHWVLETWKSSGRPSGLRVLDIGAGSGCIPIAIKKNAPALEVSGLDIRQDVLDLAAENAVRNQVPVDWIRGDILIEKEWKSLGRFDYIISNPPYIPPSQKQLMPEHVLLFEPELALFAPENDPLIFYREIGLFAHRNLTSGGYLFFETNEFNAGRVVELLQDIGFNSVELRQDLMGKERMVRALSERP